MPYSSVSSIASVKSLENKEKTSSEVREEPALRGGHGCTHTLLQETLGMCGVEAITWELCLTH